MTPLEAYEDFLKRSGTQGSHDLAMAFFVGHSFGAIGVRENIDALIKAFNQANVTIEEAP